MSQSALLLQPSLTELESPRRSAPVPHNDQGHDYAREHQRSRDVGTRKSDHSVQPSDKSRPKQDVDHGTQAPEGRPLDNSHNDAVDYQTPDINSADLSTSAVVPVPVVLNPMMMAQIQDPALLKQAVMPAEVVLAGGAQLATQQALTTATSHSLPDLIASLPATAATASTEAIVDGQANVTNLPLINQEITLGPALQQPGIQAANPNMLNLNSDPVSQAQASLAQAGTQLVPGQVQRGPAKPGQFMVSTTEQTTTTTNSPGLQIELPQEVAPAHSMETLKNSLPGQQLGLQKQQQNAGENWNLDALGTLNSGPTTSTGSDAISAKASTSVNSMDALSNPLDKVVANQVTQQLNRAIADQQRVLTIRLTPPELGTVKVQIIEQAGSLQVKLQAEDDGVRAALERALPNMRQELRNGDSIVRDLQLADNHLSFQQEQQQEQQANGQQGHGRQSSQGTFSLDGDALSVVDETPDLTTARSNSVGANGVDATA